MKLPRSAGATCALVTALSGSSAFAQAVEPAALAPVEVEEVLVTATKAARAESLQKVPSAITAVSAERLGEAQITDLVGVARLAPNVQLETSSTYVGYPAFTIRGIGINTSLRTVDNAVSVIVDGMPLAFPIGQVFDTFDIQSVEVLRGPQGVLQGRNATGGAVVIQTRRPSRDFGYEASLRAGNGGRLDWTAMVEGPLAGETLRGKVAIAHRTLDGLFKDNNSGSTVPAAFNPSGLNTSPRKAQTEYDDWLIRSILVWEPTSDLTIDVVGEYIENNDGGSTSRLIRASSAVTGAGGFGYTPPPFGDAVIDHGGGGLEFSDTKALRLGLNVRWDVGPGVITAITGYRDGKFWTRQDNDGTPFHINNSEGTDKAEQISQEIRFASDFSDRYKFLVGGYYSEMDMYNLFQGHRVNTLTNAPSWLQGIGYHDSQTWALFGNLDVTILEALTLSAGARYTHDEKHLRATPAVVCAGPGYTGCSSAFYEFKKSWKDVSPRLAARYQVNRDLMVYGSWSKGFRGGAFNHRANRPEGFQPARPESASAFELGVKSQFWDNRARLNLAAFRTSYKDIQRGLSTPDALSVLVNAADAKITGAEVEGTLLPFTGLEINASVGWTDAKFNSFDLNLDGVSSPAEEALEFERVPKWTVFVGAAYEFSLPSLPGSFKARTSYSWRSAQFPETTNNPILRMPSYGLWDMSLGYEPNEHLRILAYGRNLTDENYWDIANNIVAPSLNIGAVVFGGEPRTYGIEISYRF